MSVNLVAEAAANTGTAYVCLRTMVRCLPWPLRGRSSNRIESTFATVKLRTAKTREHLSRATALTTVFELCRVAEKNWRGLVGPAQQSA